MEASTQARTPSSLPFIRSGAAQRESCSARPPLPRRGRRGLDAKDTPKRQRTHIKIWCSPDEKAAIEELAASVGESASSYLRLVGLGHQPRSMIDREQARELVRVNGDLGRLGGLLKLWLTDDPKLDEFKPQRMARIIRGVLTKIEANQEELRAIVKTVLRARG